MKSALKVIVAVLGVLAVLVVITLLAWVSWQVMPDNPYHDQWRWNLPPFPLAIAVWMVGMVPTILLAFVSFIISSMCMAIIEKLRHKPPSTNT